MKPQDVKIIIVGALTPKLARGGGPQAKQLQEAVDKLFHHTNMFMNRLFNDPEL